MQYHPDRTMSLSVVIPTLERGPVLIETVEHVLRLPDVDEIVIVDQTAEHPPEIAARLQGWEDDGTICWLRLAETVGAGRHEHWAGGGEGRARVVPR